MANLIDDVMPKILAMGVMTLREQCVMPRAVNGDYSAEAKQKGSTIDVPVPTAKAAADVVPSNTPKAPSDGTVVTVPIPLDQWKESNFHLKDDEIAKILASKTFMPMQVAEAIRALSNAANTYLHGMYKGVYGYTGTAGTTPFASDVTAATNARKVLAKQLAPKDNRRFILNADAEANALALPAFYTKSTSDDGNVMGNGEMGRKFGFDFGMDDNVATHVAGTILDGAVAHQGTLVGAQTVGLKTMNLDKGAEATLTGTVVVGDIFTVAGDTQTYVVTANTASGNFAGETYTAAADAISGITFEPAAKVAWADNALVTFKATHVVNLAFHRDAIAFAMRPLLETEVSKELNPIMSMQDPVTGIVVRLEITRQYKQTMWQFDMLYGGALIRRELASRVAG